MIRPMTITPEITNQWGMNVVLCFCPSEICFLCILARAGFLSASIWKTVTRRGVTNMIEKAEKIQTFFVLPVRKLAIRT